MSTSSQPATTTAGSKKTESESVQQNAPAKSGVGLGIIAIIMALAAAAGTGFTWYQMQVARVGQQSNLLADIASIGSQVTILNDRLAQLQARESELVTQAQFETTLLKNQTALAAELADITAVVEQTTTAVDELRAELTQGTRELQLDDIAELLKAANVSALVLNNKQGALSALRLAERGLQELGDVRFTQVRQKILNDIAQLQDTPSLDMGALSVRIQSLANKVQSLGLQNEPQVVDSAQSNSETVNVASQQGTGVTGFFSELARDLQNALSVKIQRVDQPPTPLLPPEQRYFLDLNLSLALNKAEIAALQSRATVYAQSLEQAQHWVSSYYDTTDADVVAYLAELEALKQIEVSVELPSVANGYADFIAIREGLN